MTPKDVPGAAGGTLSWGKAPPCDHRQRDQYRQAYGGGQNNFQVESPHSPLVRLRSIDLSTPRLSPSQRIEQCIGFYTPLLAELRFPDTAANFPGGKQIYRQSWKRWKMQM